MVDIDLPASSKDVKLELYDIQSRLILVKDLGPQTMGGKKTFSLSVEDGLAPGNYLLKLVTDQGQKVIKLVKGK